MFMPGSEVFADVTHARPDMRAETQTAPCAAGDRPPLSDSPRQGLPYSTLLETLQGWQPVAQIMPGDMIETLDNGLCPVRGVQRSRALSRPQVHVPAGALHNDQALDLPPGQLMMIDGLILERLFGIPVALVRAADLVGLAGIAERMPGPMAGLWHLRFDHDEIVWANGGMCLFCEAAEPGGAGSFDILSPAQARLYRLSAESARLGMPVAA